MLSSITDKTFALFENPACRKVAAELEKAGAQILKFPLLEAEKVILNEDSEKFLSRLKNFDWIIFPDVLAVGFFLEILEEKAIDFFELDELRVCACGEVISDRLRFVQLHADVIPPRTEPKEIMTALKKYIGDEEFQTKKILLLKESSNSSELKNELANYVQMSELSVYQIKIPQKNEIAKLKTLLRGGAIDEFIFSAPSDFIWLNYIFGGEPLERILSGIEISALDGSMFQTAREHNLKRAILFQPGKIDTVVR